MNNDDIIKMCRSLARKYNDPQEYDDLVSEGVIKCLELRAEGKTNGAILHKSAAVAMNEYYNIKRAIVHVPVQGKAKSMTADDDVDGWTATALQQALYGDSVEYEEYMSQVPSTEDLYEHKEWLAYVQSLAVSNLNADDWKLMKMRFWEDMTQQEVSEVLQISRQAVTKREKAVLSKLHRLLELEKSTYKQVSPLRIT
jgi:RNA polymerase sigma factor (sigma-70 family)